MSASPRFWNFIAKRYSRQRIADETSYQKKLEHTRKHFNKEMDVLEFACGTGSTAIFHAPRVNHYHAIDISPKMLEIARIKASEANCKNLTFELSSIEDFSRPNESFDAILGMSILHLLENKEAVISRVYQLLKPGGVFVSSTTCLNGIPGIAKSVLRLGSFIGLLPLLNFFTGKELENALTNAGFTIDYSWQPGEDKAIFIIAKKSV